MEQVAKESLLEEHFQKAVQEVTAFFQAVKDTYGTKAKGKIFFQVSMLSRLILSAVICGDRRDTSEFMESGGAPAALDTKAKMGWKERAAYYEERIAQFDSSRIYLINVWQRRRKRAESTG